MSIFRSAAMGAVGAIAILGLTLSSDGAAASPAINPGSASALQQPSLVQAVDYHRRSDRRYYDDRRRYDRRYHGDRYRSPRGAYTYRYTDGYYYANPWWALGLGAILAEPVRPHRVRPIAPARSQAHVAWCFDRYRSYNQRSDTFTGYDGVVRPCRSPYR